MNYVGALATRYSYPDRGLSAETGFDCSGFVKTVLIKSGIEVPAEVRNVRHFFDSFGIAVHQEVMRPADLIFFSWTGGFPQHMGIVVNETHYVHAHTRDRLVKKAAIRTRDIDVSAATPLYVRNPIGFKRIAFQDNGYRWPI